MRLRPSHITFTLLCTAYTLVLALMLAASGKAAAAAPAAGNDGNEGHLVKVAAHDEETAGAGDPLGDGVVATVNDRPIARQSLDSVAAQLEASGQATDTDQILDELINLEVLTQAAEAQALEKRPEVAAALQLQYTQTMANAFLANLGEKTKMTDAQLRAEYDRQIGSLDGKEYRASHVLVDSKAEAQTVIDELAAGDSFKAVARRHSKDATASDGGDLGWFDGGSMVAEFSAAVERLKVGETSPSPVRTEFGWHVIKLVDERGTAKPAFASVKAELRERVLREKLVAEVQKLRAAANIQQ